MDFPPKNRNIKGGQSGRAADTAPADESFAPGGEPRPPKNIRQTETWKASSRGMNRLWSNYRNVLVRSWQNMSRSQQENLVQRFCFIVTIGATVVLFLILYGMIPRTIRVFGLPAAIFGAYWAGVKIVTPVVLVRIDNLLNKE